MKRIFRILSLLLSFLSCLTVLGCSNPTVQVYGETSSINNSATGTIQRSSSLSQLRIDYINGMTVRNTDAQKNLDSFQEVLEQDEPAKRYYERIQSLFQNPEFKLQYNPMILENDPAKNGILQLYGSMALKALEAGYTNDQAWQIAYQALGNPILGQQYGGIVKDFLPGADILINNIIEELFNNDQAESQLSQLAEELTSNTLDAYIGDYLSRINDGVFSLIIPHSQGTLFTSVLNRRLREQLGEDKVKASCFLSAVPFSNMAGDSPSQANGDQLYLTFDNDRVVNLVRESTAQNTVNPAPTPLPGNLGDCAKYDKDTFFCHRFNPTYIKDSTSAQQVKIYGTISLAVEEMHKNYQRNCSKAKIGISPSLPFIVNNGDPKQLQIKVLLLDPDTDKPLFDPGDQPPLQVKLIPIQYVNLAATSGITDGDGNFTVWNEESPGDPVPVSSNTGTQATLTENLQSAIIRIEVRKDATSPQAGMNMISSRSIGDPDAFEYAVMTDPCTRGDAAELSCQANAFTDPNFLSFDGWRSSTVEEGDFIYARTLNGTVELQARHIRYGLIQRLAIRDGQDRVEFNQLLSTLSAGEILVNGTSVTLSDSQPYLYLPQSGMSIVRHIPETQDRLNIADAYSVTTSTGDRFQIDTRHATLTLTSAINSRGQLEGILGNGDGDRSNDMTPRQGSPLDTRNYTMAAFRNFILSWRVNGEESLFANPIIPNAPAFDAWSNPLRSTQMRQSFNLFRQLFGAEADPFLAWRFSVDRAAGLELTDLEDIYNWALDRQFPLPRPPIDADINNNDIPDVNEPRLWNFDQELGYTTVGSARIQNDGYELTPAATYRTGGVYLTTPITQVPWRFEFEFAFGSGISTPADGLAFSFDPTLSLTAGGGLGLPPNLNGGFAVALDTFSNGSASPPELQIRQGNQGATTSFGETNVLAKSPATPELLSDQWQKATVSYDGTTISATFGSTTVSAPFTLTPNNYYAKVVAATGFFYNQHKMRNPVFIPLYREELGEAARNLTDSPPLPPVELLQPNPDHT